MIGSKKNIVTAILLLFAFLSCILNIEFVYIILRNNEEDVFVQTVENNSFHHLKTLTNHTTLSSTLKLFDTTQFMAQCWKWWMAASIASQ